MTSRSGAASAYNAAVDEFRELEFPMLKGESTSMPNIAGSRC